MLVDLVAARHLADAEYGVLEAPETDATTVFVFLAPVIFVLRFCDTAVALVAVYVVIWKTYSARATLVAVVERLFVLIDEAHELANIAMHGAELETTFPTPHTEGLFLIALSALYHCDMSPIERMVFDVVMALSATVKFLTDRALLETATDVVVAPN